MYLFDKVEEQYVNGMYDVFAINELDNQGYLLRKIETELSASGLEGFKLIIRQYPETYVYRGNFQTKSDMENYANNITRLIETANKKNL